MWCQLLSVPLWCNLFNRGGPSRLQPALYFFIRSIKKFPTHKKENTEISYVEQIHLELYGPPGFLNNQFPSVGKMNSYNKYTILIEKINNLYYLCVMETILMILFYLVVLATILIGGSVMTLKHFPTSKVSSFIRRHIITDVDLEP